MDTKGVQPSTVVVCDDHRVFAEALAGVLPQHGFTVVAVTTGISACAAAVARHRPAIALVADPLPDSAALSALTAEHPGTRVIVLGVDSTARDSARALRAGAVGYMHKSGSLRSLATALNRALAGEVVIDLSTPRRAADPHSPRRLAAHLTPRERECLALLVEGAGTEAIRAHLGVSVTTVRTHVQALLTKLGVHSRLEAASLAVRHNLLAVED
jgi:two-component system nitrate/nitrite response regulator NarL